MKGVVILLVLSSKNKKGENKNALGSDVQLCDFSCLLCSLWQSLTGIHHFPTRTGKSPVGILDPVMTSAEEASKCLGQALHLEVFFPRTTCFQGLHTNTVVVISILHHLLLIWVDLDKSILISFLPPMFLKTQV